MSTAQEATSRCELSLSRILLLVILLLGAVLRVYRLDAQSFWNDEGNSARIAERSINLVIEGAGGDVHPPGYYLLLHLWRAALGQSEFALRFLSVVAGLTLVALTYRLGRRLFDEAIGLIAAFLGAISPFAVYYSQEARMYALLAALSAASTCVVSGIVLRQERTEGGVPRASRLPVVVSDLLQPVGYVLLGAAGLYTHYAFVFVLAAHNVAFGVWWLVALLRSRLRWRALALWVGAQATALLLYLPWLPRALAAAGWSSAGGTYRLGAALLDVLRVLTVGTTLPLGEAAVALAVAGSLLLLGLVPWKRKHETRRPSEPSPWVTTVTLLITLLVPLALFFGVDLYKPAWLKFLVVILPSYHVLVARGIRRLGGLLSRGLRLVARSSPASSVSSPVFCAGVLVVLVALTCPSLRNLYFNPAYFRDDYRQLAADIRAMRRSGDAIILNAPNQWEVFTYYYPDQDVYPAPYRPGVERAEQFLAPILEEHRRVFVLYWGDGESDPRRRIESWLAEHAYKAADRWYGDVRLATYGVCELPHRPHVALDVRFGGSHLPATDRCDELIHLRGYAVAASATFGPGDVVPLTLFWEAEGPLEASYKVTVQLLDEEGRLSAQVDTVPGDGLAPTTSWEEGQVVVDRYGVYLPWEIPPGRYWMIVALYHPVSGERLTAVVDGEEMGDHVLLRHVTVEVP